MHNSNKKSTNANNSVCTENMHSESLYGYSIFFKKKNGAAISMVCTLDKRALTHRMY